MDISSNKRTLLFDYVVNKYGKECCALVSTFSTRKARGSIKDTSRIFNIEPDFADYTSKLIPDTYYDENGDKNSDVSIDEALEINSELKTVEQNNKDWFLAAKKMEGLERTTSIHAAGTLISPIPLNEYIPLIRNNSDNKNILATALDLSDCEYAGAIKYDFLALNTLDIIYNTEKDTGFKINFDDDNMLNDNRVWELIGSKNTDTLFQISSDTYKKRMSRLKPHTIKELANCLALVRGPCISSKLDIVYMDVVQGKRDIELIHPFYDSVTERTNGVLLFQEQTMQILENFGMTQERSFQVMKFAAKKKITKLKEAEEEFIQLAIKNNVSKEVYTRIWNIIVDTGKYSFNESHAIAYALISYYTAYLKIYYPLQWMKNSLTNAFIKKNNIIPIINECKRIGIHFLKLNANSSSYECSIEDNKIKLGFCSLSGIGEIAYNALCNSRPINDLNDIVNKISGKFNKKNIILSIFGGAFDFINNNRLELYKDYCKISKNEFNNEIKISKDNKFKSNDDIQNIEEKLFGVSICNDMIDELKNFDLEEIKEGQICNTNAIIRKIRRIKDKNGNSMAFVTLEMSCGYINGVIFNNIYSNNTENIKKNIIINISAKKNKDSLIIQKIAV